MMLTGLDRLRASAGLQKQLRGAKVALLAHPASVDRDLVHVSDVLATAGIAPVIVFGPEHGYGGEAQDMIGVADAKDARGTPVRSLYGARFEDLSPRGEDLRGVDVLLIDLQDVGARYYTFVWTAVLAVRACAKAGVHVVVLDRPNPIGAELEGRLPTDPQYLSFVGLEPIAVRHGNTLGEIVAWRADVEKLPREQIGIVQVEGIDRAAHATSWDRAFVMPSPNMPTYETALVYPGGCLLEGTNLSEGRGTTRPFEIFGAPWIDGVRLANDFHALHLSGCRARPLTFRPTFHKHAGQSCGGVEVHVTDPRAFRPYAAYLALIALAQRQSPDRFAFRTEAYEFRDDVPALDLLAGGPAAREMIAAGGDPRGLIEAVALPSDREAAVQREAENAARRRSIRC